MHCSTQSKHENITSPQHLDIPATLRPHVLFWGVEPAWFYLQISPLEPIAIGWHSGRVVLTHWGRIDINLKKISPAQFFYIANRINSLWHIFSLKMIKTITGWSIFIKFMARGSTLLSSLQCGTLQSSSEGPPWWVIRFLSRQRGKAAKFTIQHPL